MKTKQVVYVYTSRSLSAVNIRFSAAAPMGWNKNTKRAELPRQKYWQWKQLDLRVAVAQ